MATNYNRGARFERKVADHLESFGYVTVRSAGSRKPADVVAMRHGELVCVQAKTNGRLDPDEWNKFFEWCGRAGAIPVLSQVGPLKRDIIYHRLLGRKDGRGRQPLASWTPQGEGNGNEVS